jgi:hypothetical protein
MGSSLEAGKLIAASFLYRYWSKISIVLKAYLTIAVIVLMVITSMGIFGFLSQSYQKDSLPLKEMQVKIDGLKKEQAQLLARKQSIDDARQGAVSAAVNNQSTKSRVVRSKERLARTFDNEAKEINKRLPELTKEIQTLDTEVLTTQLHTGPITYIAKAFGREIDDATKWVIFMLISAFDPLAVALTIGVNIVINIRRKEIDDAKLATLEKARLDKLAQTEREHQKRVDARVEEQRKRAEALEDARAQLAHEREMEALKHHHTKITNSDGSVIESFDDEITAPHMIADPDEVLEVETTPTIIENVITPTENNMVTTNISDLAIADMYRILDNITAKQEPTPEELASKRQIESILSRRQILDNMRGGSVS